MKITATATLEIEVEIKDVLTFLMEDKLQPEQYDMIILEALRRKKGYFTLSDQMKYEIFEGAKERFTPEELEQRLL